MADEMPRVGGRTFLVDAVLYILASPVFGIIAIARFIAASRAKRVIRAGFLKCPACHSGNRLDCLVTCTSKDCGWVEHRSLALPCSRCGQKRQWITCATCGASIALP